MKLPNVPAIVPSEVIYQGKGQIYIGEKHPVQRRHQFNGAHRVLICGPPRATSARPHSVWLIHQNDGITLCRTRCAPLNRRPSRCETPPERGPRARSSLVDFIDRLVHTLIYLRVLAGWDFSGDNDGPMVAFGSRRASRWRLIQQRTSFSTT